MKNTLDVDGDLAQVQSRKSNGTLQNYANAFTYTSAGAVSSMRLGNGKFENTTFNSRLQPIQIGLGSSATSQNLLKLNFDYGSTDNNGNVKSQIITTPTVGNIAGFTATQNYTYDSLNRLKSAEETIPNQLGWKQTFKYDRYGNREFDTTNNNTNTLANGCPVAVCNPSANPNDNKLVGTNYDNVGNTKIDANGQTFTYDAENKQTKVVNAQGVTLGEYFYDGDGKRIKKFVPLTNETTIFVYDASGKMVAEYSTVSASQTEAKISYLTNDHLGSPRITTDATGKVISRRDFLPFGEEIARAGNGTDKVRQRFTGYERDGEIEEDYAQARYYNYKLGRFNSVDPLMASADIINPQTFNRYAYVGNNPINITDPTGEIWGVNDTGTIQWFNGALGAGFTAYNLLYGVIQGTSQMVALNPNGGYVQVASAAAWLTQEITWGGTAATLSAGAAALAGVPVAVAALALAEILDPAGRWRTGMNMPEPAREFAGTKQSYWNDFMAAMSKGKESTPSSGNTQSEPSSNTATPDPKDNEPKQTNREKNKENETRRKEGSLGQRKGTDALRRENEQPAAAARQAGLTKDQVKRFHRAISGKNYTYRELVKLATKFKYGK